MTKTTDFRALLADDAYAVSFQSLGQYRTALLKALDATPPPEPPTDEELYEYWISTSPQFGCADPVGFARAVLERWGR